MNNTWLKVKVWTKLILFALVLIYVLAFIYKNSGSPVTFWYMFFVQPLQTDFLYFTFFVFLAGILVAVLLRTTYVTVKQFREMRRRQRIEQLEQENAEMREKAARLRTNGGPGAADADPRSPDADKP